MKSIKVMGMSVGGGLLALATVACGAAPEGAMGTEPVSDSEEAVSLGAKDLLPNAAAVEAVNATLGKQTLIFYREATGIFGVIAQTHSTGNFDTQAFLAGCCMVGRPAPTVWKQSGGAEDNIVVYIMNNSGTISENTLTPSGVFGSCADVNAMAGLPAGYTLHSASLTGVGSAKKVNLVVSNASNNLFTLDFNDFGNPGWALHTVLTSTGTQLNTRGYTAMISADGIVIGGRNTLSSGNESTVWRAIRNGAHFQVDFTSSSPGTSGLPTPGRFISGQSGTLQNGIHYRGASNGLLMRQTTSLCPANSITGTVGTSSHLAAVNSTTANQLLINGFTGTCVTSSNPTASAPSVSDESKLTGWSSSVDGTHILYKNTSGHLASCWLKGTSTVCSGGVVDTLINL